MNRAAVLIGVRKAGNLQTLQAVYAGVEAMQEWAERQAFGTDNIFCVTDEREPVTAGRIKAAVRNIVKRGTCEQLVIYFAGHGVNIRYGEYWLLSGAPEDTQEAVNVEGSQALARRCGVPHVVFISDACRTAAEGIQAQYVTGSEIFPNEGGNGQEMSVDLFFACTLGKPALEIKDATKSGAVYQALYTNALVAALQGTPPSLSLEIGNDGARYVRPRPLKRFLSRELNEILATLTLPAGINQTPDARITSDESAWLARLQPEAPAAAPFPRAESVRAAGRDRGGQLDGDSAGASAWLVSRELIGAALEQALPTRRVPPPPPGFAARGENGADALDSEALADVAAADEATLLVRSARATNARIQSPARLETGCGFRLRGERFASVRALQGVAEIADADRTSVRVQPPPGGTSVVLRFEGGGGTVLPAIAQFAAELTFEAQELVTVSYEVSENSALWLALRDRLTQLRWLRSVVSSSAALGVFALEGQEALHLARMMQFNKQADPSMAVYAAYAYHGLGRTDLIREMRGYMEVDLGVTLFDVAMLSRETVGRRQAPLSAIPMFPLLAQGWGLLTALEVSLPGNLIALRRHLRPSLWTVFDDTGIDLVDSLIKRESQDA